MKLLKKLKFVLIISLVFVLSALVRGFGSAYSVDSAISYISDFQFIDGSIQDDEIVTDWAVIAIVSQDLDLKDVKKFDNSLYDFINDDSLTIESATDIERRILAIASADLDPRDTDIDLVNKLYQYYQGGQFGEPYLVNDDIFAILALLAAGEEKNSVALDNTKDFVLQSQNPNGSFSYHIAGGGDVDDSAAAIEALSFFKEETEIKNAIFSARSYLIVCQNSDGGFGFNLDDESSNLGSTSWAIRAIYALGEDPYEWVKNQRTPIDFLLSCQNPNGSFSYIPGNSPDLLMTAYAVLALSGKSLPVAFVDDYCDKNIDPPSEPSVPPPFE